MSSVIAPFRIKKDLCAAVCLTSVLLTAPVHGQNQAGYSNTAHRFAQLPLAFEPNLGHSSNSADFVARGQSYSLAVDRSSATLAAWQQGGPRSLVRMTLVGTSAVAKPEPLDELPGKVNYLRGADQSKWRTDVPTYQRIRYSNVYSGIDIVYYGNQGNLEYDFVVAPGTSPSKIELRFDGAESIRLAASGDMVLSTGGSEMRLHKPVAYQDFQGKRQIRPAQFRLLADGRVGFDIPEYDHQVPLIIDPVLSYSAVLGGFGAFAGGDQYSPLGKGLAVDAAGNVYVTGSTYTSDLPTQSAYQATPSALNDAFVAKLSADGSSLIYATYLGGDGTDISRAIAVDSSGNAIITGSTSSTNFPLQNPAQTAGHGFVAKLNSTGNALIYSTYLGGSSTDDVYAVAVDAAGNAYAAGSTSSWDFPATLVPHHTPTFFSSDAFIAKYSPQGAKLYADILGGDDLDYAYAVAVDATGAAYMTGSTCSANYPTTAGAFRTVYPGACQAFVTKVNASGSAVVYSTFLGGTSSPTTGFAIAVDTSLSAYITGSTSATDFPVAGLVVQPHFGGGDQDAFVTKLSPDGASLVYSTFFGGSLVDTADAISVDSAGNATVAGYTYSGDFPTVTPLQPAKAGASASLFLSNDGGATWTAKPGLGYGSEIWVAPGVPSTVYASYWSSIYRSQDGGNTWTYRGNVNRGSALSPIAIDPANENTLYTVAMDGVRKSGDGGATWSICGGGIGSGVESPLAIVAATNAIYVANGFNGLFKSTDGCGTWASLSLNTNGSMIQKIVVNPVSPAVVYVAAGTSVYKSTNGGSSWVQLPSPCCTAINLTMDPSNQNVLYTWEPQGLYRSSDAGQSWNLISTSSSIATAMAIDPANPSTMYASLLQHGIARSSDGGVTWTPVNANAPFIGIGANANNIQGLAVVQLNPSRVLVGVSIQSDLFVAKLNASASGVLYSTYLGSPDSDVLAGFATGNSAVYLATNSVSPLMPGTAGAYRSPNGQVSVIKMLESTSCSISVWPSALNASYYGLTGQVRVVTGANCPWSATTAPWIHVTSNTSSSGLGTIDLSFDANNTTKTRTGNITVNGQTATVTQPSASTCSINSLTPISLTPSAGASAFTVSVSPSNCTWTATSNNTWLTITSGGSGVNAGNVQISATANQGTSTRTGTITVATVGNSATETVTQSGAAQITISAISSTCFSASVQGVQNHATTWTVTPQVGSLYIVPIFVGITPGSAQAPDQLDIACYTPATSGTIPASVTLTATSVANPTYTTNITLDGHTGKPK